MTDGQRQITDQDRLRHDMVTWWQRVVVIDLRLQENVIPLGQNRSQIVKTNIDIQVHSLLNIPYIQYDP